MTLCSWSREHVLNCVSLAVCGPLTLNHVFPGKDEDNVEFLGKLL